MAYENPTIENFKARFFRDFPYGTTLDTVVDQDITLALNKSGMMFNPALWESQSAYTEGFLLLSAHYLVVSLRGSSQGIAGGYSWLENQKSAGSVSGGYTIPQRILDNPEFAMLSKTSYGAEFLFMILPKLSGQMFVVCGSTRP